MYGRNIFDDLFDPFGMTESAFVKWLNGYLTYDAVKCNDRDNLPKIRQFVLFDALMKYSPAFRKELNEYRKEEVARLRFTQSVKLGNTLKQINKLFDDICKDETVTVKTQNGLPEVYLDFDNETVTINFNK